MILLKTSFSFKEEIDFKYLFLILGVHELIVIQPETPLLLKKNANGIYKIQKILMDLYGIHIKKS